MAERPEALRRELPAQFAWRPRPLTWDPIDMEFVINQIDNPQIRNQIIGLRLEAYAQSLRIAADAAQKAAGLIGGAGGG
jgi:hypothetical protein